MKLLKDTADGPPRRIPSSVPELWLGRRDQRRHRRAKFAEAIGGQVGVNEEVGEPDAFGGQRSIQLSYGSSDAQDHSVRIGDAQCLGGTCFHAADVPGAGMPPTRNDSSLTVFPARSIPQM